MSAAGQRRIEQIDIAKGIAGICMILGHSFIVYPIDISSVWWCCALRAWIYSFHMELFFFLSGAVWKPDDFKIYIIRKSKRILLPYVSFGIFSVLLRILGTSLVNHNMSLTDGVFSFLFFGGGIGFFIHYSLFILFITE